MMESAEEFALLIAKECHYGSEFDLADCAKLVEARDAAVALAVLDSIENRIREQFIRERSDEQWKRVLQLLLVEQRRKYTQPTQQSQESGG